MHDGKINNPSRYMQSSVCTALRLAAPHECWKGDWGPHEQWRGEWCNDKGKSKGNGKGGKHISKDKNKSWGTSSSSKSNSGHDGGKADGAIAA